MRQWHVYERDEVYDTMNIFQSPTFTPMSHSLPAPHFKFMDITSIFEKIHLCENVSNIKLPKQRIFVFLMLLRSHTIIFPMLALTSRYIHIQLTQKLRYSRILVRCLCGCLMQFVFMFKSAQLYYKYNNGVVKNYNIQRTPKLYISFHIFLVKCLPHIFSDENTLSK